MGPTQLTHTQVDVIGFVGGGVLAICLIPQVARVLITRSARDISVSWSVLYSIGLALSLTYLILKDAIAAWIPIIFELVGCVLVLLLKLFYEHTERGRRYSAAKQHQHEAAAAAAAAGGLPPWALPYGNGDASSDGHAVTLRSASLPASWAQTHGLHHRSLATSLGHAALAAVSGGGGDISYRGSAVLGRRQDAPDGSVAPLVDMSARSGRSYFSSGGGGGGGGSAHGGGGGRGCSSGNGVVGAAAELGVAPPRLGSPSHVASAAAAAAAAADQQRAAAVPVLPASGQHRHP